jgi:hypothetical protein
VVGAVARFLERRGEVAGAALSRNDLQAWVYTASTRQKMGRRPSWSVQRVKETAFARLASSRCSDPLAIARRSSAVLRDREFRVGAAWRQGLGEKRDAREGVSGLYMEGLAWRRGQGLARGGASGGQERNRAGAGLLPELDDDLTGRPHLSASVQGWNVPVRVCAGVGCGPLLGPGQNGAPALLSFFCSLVFLFLFSNLFLSKTFAISFNSTQNNF